MKIQKLSHLMNRYLPSLGLALLIAIPIYTPADAIAQGLRNVDAGSSPSGQKGFRHNVGLQKVTMKKELSQMPHRYQIGRAHV